MVLYHRPGYYDDEASTPTPPPFSPDDLTGLRVWLDASTLALAHGAEVTSWPDLSGNGKNFGAVAGTAPAFQAAGQNGLGTVRFTTGKAMATATNPQTGASAGTLVTVQKSTADPQTSPAAVGALVSKWGSHGGVDFQPYEDGLIYHGWGSTVRKTVGNPPATLAAFRVHVMTTAAGAWRYHLDGGSPFHTAAGNVVGWFAGVVSLGAWHGDACEVVAYDRVLPAADLNQVGDYLAAKWGVTWSPVS